MIATFRVNPRAFCESKVLDGTVFRLQNLCQSVELFIYYFFDHNKTMNYTDFKSSQFFACIAVFCLAGLLVNFSSAFAEKEQVGLNADVSTKINLGKAEVTTNSTTQANAS